MMLIRFFPLFLLYTVCFGYYTHGQDLCQKHNIGIRAGIGAASSRGKPHFDEAIIRLHAGMSYEYRPHHNWGVETGVYLQTKGGAKTYDGVTTKLNLWYLELPILCNYHIHCKQIEFIPFIGFYYGYCMKGELRDKYGSVSWLGKYEKKRLVRSDWGARLGGGISWRHIYFAIGYDWGLSNIGVRTLKYQYGEKIPIGMRLKTGLFFTTVGWNF